MTAAEAIEYIEKGIWSTTRLGLERTYELLDLLVRNGVTPITLWDVVEDWL